jgi:hypothetical protein
MCVPLFAGPERNELEQLVASMYGGNFFASDTLIHQGGDDAGLDRLWKKSGPEPCSPAKSRIGDDYRITRQGRARVSSCRYKIRGQSEP